MPTPREAYDNSVRREGFTNARLQPADYGAGGEMIGRAVEGFGHDIAKVTDNLTEIAKRDAETAAREADNLRTQERLQRLYDGPEAYYNQEGRNALEDREKLKSDLKLIDDKYADLVKHKPFAQRLYQDMTLRRDADELPRIAIHANKERNKFEEQVDNDAMNNAVNAAQLAEDPVAIERNLATVADIAERKTKRKGLDTPESIDLARKASIGVAVEAIASKMELDKGPAEAQAFVVAHAGQMDPDDAGKILKSLAAPAAQERATSEIGQFLVVQGQTAPAPAAGATAAGAAANKAGYTLHPSDEALDAAQFTGPGAQEGASSHTDANGNLIRSPKGAAGVTQVMPLTGVDPGYGVKPLQNNSRAEYIRFGRDLRKAYIKHFNGNIVLGLTAYNWGPGNVEDHIRKVGDPSKGQISDAAFINSIPVKEAREYAAEILNRTGTPVAGLPGPNAGKPVPVGQEVDLDATINNIRKSDRSWVDQQALIAEATRLHGYGRQVKAENDEQLTDATWQAVNALDAKGGFTDYNQLPLTLRKRMETSKPELAASMRNQAESNKNGELTAKGQETQLDLLELQMQDPQRFATQIDLRTQYPELNHSTRVEMMNRQEAIRKSMDGTSNHRIDYEAMRTSVNRYKGNYDKDKDLGVVYDSAIRKAEAWLQANPGKDLPDAVRDGIAREEMMKTTIVRPGKLFGTNAKTMTRAEAELDVAKNGRARNIRVDPREQVRAELQQIWGRTPTEDEVTREVGIRTARGTYSK